jgi:hypothetical protein
VSPRELCTAAAHTPPSAAIGGRMASSPSEPHRHLYNLPWPPYCTPRAPQVACVHDERPVRRKNGRSGHWRLVPPSPSPARPRSRPTLGIGRRPSRAFPSPELSSLRQPWRQGPNCNLNFCPEGLSAKFEGLFVNLSLLDLGEGAESCKISRKS